LTLIIKTEGHLTTSILRVVDFLQIAHGISDEVGAKYA
jgi:hypothetical protein